MFLKNVIFKKSTSDLYYHNCDINLKFKQNECYVSICFLAHSLALHFFPTRPPRFQNDFYFEIRARFPPDGQLTWVNCWQGKLAGGGSEPVAVPSAWATNVCWDNDCSPMFSSRLTLTRRFFWLTRLPVRPGTLRLFCLRLFVLAEWGPCEQWAGR